MPTYSNLLQKKCLYVLIDIISLEYDVLQTELIYFMKVTERFFTSKFQSITAI